MASGLGFLFGISPSVSSFLALLWSFSFASSDASLVLVGARKLGDCACVEVAMARGLMFWSKAEVLQKTGPLKGLGKAGLVSDRGRGRQNQSMMNDWRHAHTPHQRQGSGVLWDLLLRTFQLSSVPTCYVTCSIYLLFRWQRERERATGTTQTAGASVQTEIHVRDTFDVRQR